MHRRGFLAKTATLAATAVAVPAVVRAAEGGVKRYRVAVIGLPAAEIMGTAWTWFGPMCPASTVAVADADPQGLAAAAKTLQVAKAYADYRRMLEEVKPDLVTIATRWVDQHHDMLLAAAERVNRLVEKYQAVGPDLGRGRRDDRRLPEAQDADVRRVSDLLQPAAAGRRRGLTRSGQIGQVLEFRARGKEDARGGAEDLLVLVLCT